jgi:Xaa-Pro aminopeptidase
MPIRLLLYGRPESLREDLDGVLAENGAEALFLYSDSFKQANMYYLSGFLAPDPFVLLKKVGGEAILVINPMEHSRAQKEAGVKDVRSYSDYDYFGTLQAAVDPKLGLLKFIAGIAQRELGSKTTIFVPPEFPTIFADAFRKEGLTITSSFDVIEKARETKEADEIEHIKHVQTVVETVTAHAIDVIAAADIDGKGTLVVREDGKRQPLTVGKLKATLGHGFLDHRCVIDEEIIVACGPKGADPHYFGRPEDALKANQPIILDIYPRSVTNRYCTDMTRTVVKGRATREVKSMFAAVLEAKNASTDRLKAGAPGSEAYNTCCDILERAGYVTTRGGRTTNKGFTHSLGHGIGLQVHESPRLSELYTDGLEERNVVTVEPGLYDPRIGGVRIEDIVELTKSSCINLSKMPIVLEV